MPDANVTDDLNQVIASAVQARIESEVAAALSGSEMMGQYVAAALTQKITVEDRDYRRRETTYLRETIDAAIKAATKAAVQKVIEAEAPAIEAQVTTELRRQTKEIAQKLVGQVSELAQSAHGISVELKYPGRGY